MADEEPMVFDIPANFAEEGTMLGGRVKSRNLLETVLLFILLIQPILALQLEERMKIYLAVLLVLPVCILSIIGIQGESLSSFFMAALYFFRTRKICGRPDEAERMERSYRERRRLGVRREIARKTGKKAGSFRAGSKTAAGKQARTVRADRAAEGSAR